MQPTNSFRNVVAADANSNILVRAKPGILSSFLISKPDAHVVTLYDGIDTTTLTNNKIITTLPASMPANLYELNVCLSKGLVVAVSASYAGDYTVFHRAG